MTVDSVDLMRGKCTIFKNRAYLDTMPAIFTYDGNIREFKLVSHGQIILKFPYGSIHAHDEQLTGLIVKKQVVKLDVTNPDGNVYLLSFESSDLNSYDRLVWTIGTVKNEEEGSREIVLLMKSREKVSVADVCSILTRFGLPDGSEDGRMRIESLIASGVVDGIFDGQSYVSKNLMHRETVNYNIAASFDFKDGALRIKCPNCAAAIPLKSKEPTGKCQFCGATYAVPAKILQLI